MKNTPLNINCDLGEGLDNESVLMPLIHSCNIACGGHAGNMATMKRVVALARRHGVQIGAHPSYPDREHFGRVSMTMEAQELQAAIERQLNDFTEALEGNDDMHHIKAHGALYNDLTTDARLAETYLSVLAPYKGSALLYVPYGSVIGSLARQKGFGVAAEAFGDRNYHDNLTLVSRKDPRGLITLKEEVLTHVKQILSGQVNTVEGSIKKIKADTICLHSDTENAVEILSYLKTHLNY